MAPAAPGTAFGSRETSRFSGFPNRSGFGIEPGDEPYRITAVFQISVIGDKKRHSTPRRLKGINGALPGRHGRFLEGFG